MIGKLLRDSGRTAVPSQAQVLTSGRAQSTLNENHIKRTRYAHHVSLMSLNLLKKTAYCQSCQNTIGLPEPFDVWNKRMQSFPQFNFWSTIIDLELLMTRFLHHSGKEILSCMCKYVMNFVIGSMPWITPTMHGGCLFMCAIWLCFLIPTQKFMTNS